MAGSPQGQDVRHDGPGHRDGGRRSPPCACSTPAVSRSAQPAGRRSPAAWPRSRASRPATGSSGTPAAPHDQVLIEGVAGKFDIGGFGDQPGGDGRRAADRHPLRGRRADDRADRQQHRRLRQPARSVTKTLNGVVGADPNAAPYTIDSFTGQRHGQRRRWSPACASANKQVVTYFADTNGNGTFGDAGDTAYYRLTLNQAGAGTYTFDVLVQPAAGRRSRSTSTTCRRARTCSASSATPATGWS